ncbi:2806_t:CDS:1 [Paraglomus occultum]|uniref:2806_t:CDS:1 n=1 Tax=Paraglomus occultum TaxID=144539 RepID=A0A9N9FI28_9GLOM|nr:2806_t:CDS:1 [Paraglomus occultum]
MAYVRIKPPRTCSSNDPSSVTTPYTSTVLTAAEHNLVRHPPYHHNVPLNTLLDCRTRKKSPPRAKNLWLIFRIAFASNLRAKFPGKSYDLKEISKMASEDWKRQPFTVKRYFNALSKLALQRHKTVHPEYTYKPRGRRQKKKSQLLFIEVNEDKIMTRRSYNKNANRKQENRTDDCGEVCDGEVENECGNVHDDIGEQYQSETSQAVAEQYPVNQIISQSMNDVISETCQTVDQVIPEESYQTEDQVISGSYPPVDQGISGSYQPTSQSVVEWDQLIFPMSYIIAEQSPLNQYPTEQYPANQVIIEHHTVNHDLAWQYQSDMNQIMAGRHRSPIDQTVLEQYLLDQVIDDQYPLDNLILEQVIAEQYQKQPITEQYLLDQDEFILRQYPVDQDNCMNYIPRDQLGQVIYPLHNFKNMY